MKRPTRKQALALIAYHARKGDIGAAQRVYIENRISREAYLQAIRQK